MTPKLIKEEFIRSFPQCKDLFVNIHDVELISSSELAIPSAIVQIVIMQMLSQKAADTIYSRVVEKAKEQNLEDWQLNFDVYREAGISKTKAETIIRFANYFNENTNEVNEWYQLKDELIIKEISKLKGIGPWTASVLALSHLGKEDVFPYQDGILIKAIKYIQEKYDAEFDPDNASPLRSYLALYLWSMMSAKVFEQ